MAIPTLIISACTFGKSGKDLAVASTPGGAKVTLTSGGERFSGELVALRDDGLVVSAQKRLLFVPFSSLAAFAVHDLNIDYQLSARERPSLEKRSRLSSISQFPQGLTPEIERQLLAQLGQAAIETIQ